MTIAILSSKVCPFSMWANYSVSRTHLPVLSQTVIFEFEYYNFTVSSKWLISFITGHPGYFGSHLSIHCGRYGTRYDCSDKRFLEVPQFYLSVHKSKNTWATALLLIQPQFEVIYLIMFALPQPLSISEKNCRPGYVYGVMITELFSGSVP